MITERYILGMTWDELGLYIWIKIIQTSGILEVPSRTKQERTKGEKKFSMMEPQTLYCPPMHHLHFQPRSPY